jgi:hypothetical protein
MAPTMKYPNQDTPGMMQRALEPKRMSAGQGDASYHLAGPDEAKCDECNWGLRDPACDNDPSTCDAWYCSRGGPPCFGGSSACECNKRVRRGIDILF